MRGDLIRRVAVSERVGNFRPRAASNKEGRGIYTLTLLRRARMIVAEDHNFGGCVVDALRQAAALLDLSDEIGFAAKVMIHVCSPEVVVRKISVLPEKQRAHFRNRLLLNFENAFDVLFQAGKPSRKAQLAKRAGAEATNWAGLTKAEKDANWAATLEKAVEDLDRQRIVANSVALADKVFPHRNDPIPSAPEPEADLGE